MRPPGNERPGQDGGQGEGHWRTYLELAFDRLTQPPGYTFDDLERTTAPTLILTGDRDDVCSVEEGVEAYRRLAQESSPCSPAQAA